MGATILSAFQSSAAFRADSDILSYVGGNGSGKTMMAISDMLPVLQGIRWQCDDETHWHTKVGITSGYRNILSNVRIMNPATKQPHKLWVPYTAHNIFLVAEHSHILLDEITAIFPSRGFGALPTDVASVLNQLRKPDLKVTWTAPSWERCDIILREVTEHIVSIKRFAPKVMPGRMRKTYSRFLVRSYDGPDWKTWVERKRMGKLKAASYEFYHRRDDLRNGYQAQHYYNSFAQSMTPMSDEQAGICSLCHGNRSTKRLQCNCTPEQRETDLMVEALRFWDNQLDLDESDLQPPVVEVAPELSDPKNNASHGDAAVEAVAERQAETAASE